MCARERAEPCRAPRLLILQDKWVTNKGIEHGILAGNRWFGKPCGWLPRRIGHPRACSLMLNPGSLELSLKSDDQGARTASFGIIRLQTLINWE